MLTEPAERGSQARGKKLQMGVVNIRLTGEPAPAGAVADEEISIVPII